MAGDDAVQTRTRSAIVHQGSLDSAALQRCAAQALAAPPAQEACHGMLRLLFAQPCGPPGFATALLR